MSRVLFDSQVFAEQSRGGVSRYFLGLAGALDAHTAWRPRIALGWHVGEDVPGGLPVWGPYLRVGTWTRGFRVRRQVNRVLMTGFKPAADNETVYHPTWHHMATIRTWNHLPTTLTVHDLIPEEWPAVTDPGQLQDRRSAFRHARSIVCVSESTMADLDRYYPETSSKAVVSPPGLSQLPSGRPHLAPSQPYVLHVGKRDAYKDFHTLLKALPRMPDLRLVVVGGGSINESERAEMVRLGVSERVTAEGLVDDQRLADLYAGAVALVSASRAEGFGIPPLEALLQGKHSVLADIPVYREVHSRWATFFPVGDPGALAEAVEQVALVGPVSGQVVDEVHRRFSWTETVRGVTSAYEAALA